MIIIILLFILLIYFYFSRTNNKQKVKLVIRLPNWIGDTLMTYPLLLALQKSNIDFICIGHPWAKNLFSGTDLRIITSSKIKNPFWCYQIYNKYNFEYGLLCTNSLSTILPMSFNGIKTIGFHSLSKIKIPYNKNPHTVENYFDLSKYFNNEFTLEDCSNKIPISQENIDIGQKIIDQEIKEKEYIVICPYATNLHKGKNKEWPYWKQFCSEFKKYKIVALVSPNDYQRCLDDFPNIIVISTNLAVSAYIMKQAKYVLANDSGAMHLASFFGANVIGLFGATEINKTRPWYGKYLIGEDNNFIRCYDLISYI